MSRPNALVWLALFGPLLLASMDGRAQIPASFAGENQAAAERNLSRSVEAEERRGTYIFYSQTYFDGNHQQVIFKGSVFGVIQGMNAKGCDLRVDTTVTDSYSGRIGKRLVGETSSVYQSSFEFPFTSEVADSMHLIEARPAQLDEGTHPVCAERPGCTFQWIEIEAAHPVIRETHLTNDIDGYDGYVKDFDGMVDHFLIPMSSSDAGNDLIAKLRIFGNECIR